MSNLVGQHFGLLTAIERYSIAEKGSKRVYYLCECNCKEDNKNTVVVRSDSLTRHKTTSCGCITKSKQFNNKDITDKEFGYLTALYPTDKRSNGSIMWHCKCNNCGNEVNVAYNSLVRGDTKSCGCLRIAIMKEKGRINIKKYNDKNIIAGTNIRKISTQKLIKSNTSGYAGVSYDKDRDQWLAQIWFQGKNYYLGRFDIIDNAISKRTEAEEKKYGDFIKWYNENKPENRCLKCGTKLKSSKLLYCKKCEKELSHKIVCSKCGKVFYSMGNPKLCKECRADKYKVSRSCTICGKPFIGFSNSKICPECKALNKQETEHICKRCGKKFFSSRNIIYCDLCIKIVRSEIGTRNAGKLYRKKCKNCGNDFVGAANEQYCLSCKSIVKYDYFRRYYIAHKKIYKIRTYRWIANNLEKRLIIARKAAKKYYHKKVDGNSN